jgi:ribonucleoside-triphosphate reductase
MSPTYSICKTHGYISVKSIFARNVMKKQKYTAVLRILTSVQNWNEGKIKNMKNRKEYIVAYGELSDTGR